MKLPEQLLLSDLLRLRVRSDQGIDHGPGVLGWMHPPVHRLLGWISRPSAFGSKRLVWRLNQLRGLSEQEAFVKGDPAETDVATMGRLPTLFGAELIDADGLRIGSIADAAVELASGRIRHYLVARSDPRLPGSSRWRLSPDRIVDQVPGRVITALRSLEDLPLARASVRQELLSRSSRWRRQLEQETGRLRDRFQDAGGRLEDRVEGWLEEAPWEEPLRHLDPGRWTDEVRQRARSAWQEREGAPATDSWADGGSDPLEDWPEEPAPPPAEPSARPRPRRRPLDARPQPPADPWRDSP